MRASILILLVLGTACAREGAPPPAAAALRAPNVLLVTIDTLRADHVGAYGNRAAKTPSLDALAAKGARFDRAYATAPITLTSHASILTGRYPPGHGARHNGMRLDLTVPTLAEAFTHAGAVTAAFVAAFPLDRQFGLIRGFQTYDDEMPRDAQGHPANDRPGHEVVDRALAWLESHQGDRVFLWVHLFEPHAPYGNPAASPQRSALDRYDDDVTEADVQAGRVIRAVEALGTPALVVVVADHGEAFGEHGEVSHSVFTYDTTLRVPLIVAAPGITPRLVNEPVSLVDLAPTIASLAGLPRFDADGIDLSLSVLSDPSSAPRPPSSGARPPSSAPPSSAPRPPSSSRAIYAESFAPLLDFGWAPLRTIRRNGWKYIAAPTPELYDLAHDPGETRNVVAAEPTRAAEFARMVDAISPASLTAAPGGPDDETRARLQALGYLSGRAATSGPRPDPKDRRELAARIAVITSGELQGAALERGLRDVLRLDPANPQANLRLGYVLMNSGRCRDAMPRFAAAIAGGVPGTDAHLGLAGCQLAMKQGAAAERTLDAAIKIAPDNAVISANLGLLLSDTGRPQQAIPYLQRALARDPALDQARFGLAIAFARSGRRAEAAREAEDLLRRLPVDAPQRDEVRRLIDSLK